MQTFRCGAKVSGRGKSVVKTCFEMSKKLLNTSQNIAFIMVYKTVKNIEFFKVISTSLDEFNENISFLTFSFKNFIDISHFTYYKKSSRIL